MTNLQHGRFYYGILSLSPVAKPLRYSPNNLAAVVQRGAETKARTKIEAL